jgi:hypothetical protein
MIDILCTANDLSWYYGSLLWYDLPLDDIIYAPLLDLVKSKYPKFSASSGLHTPM